MYPYEKEGEVRFLFSLIGIFVYLTLLDWDRIRGNPPCDEF